MNQIFRTLQNVSGRRAYTPAELTVTEFPAEQGFYDTNDYVEPPGGGVWGGGEGDNDGGEAGAEGGDEGED